MFHPIFTVGFTARRVCQNTAIFIASVCPTAVFSVTPTAGRVSQKVSVIAVISKEGHRMAYESNVTQDVENLESEAAQVKTQIQAKAQELKQRAANSWEDLSDVIRRHPGKALGIALAAGLGVGAAIAALSRRRDSTAADKWRDLSESGSDAWEKIRDGLNEAVCTLKDAVNDAVKKFK